MNSATNGRKLAYFLASTFFLQCILCMAIILKVPVAIQAMSILYLVFTFGLILTKLLKLNELDTAETILFSVGLSIAFLMLTGFLVNELYPQVGITQPLSLTPLLITLSIISLIGAVIARRTKDKTENPHFNKDAIPILATSLILIILGIHCTFTINTTGNSSILTIILLIALLFVFTASSEKINPKLYPLILFATAFSLLFFACNDTALITNYITGIGDQWIEYQAFKLTETNSLWRSNMAPTPYTHVLFPTYSMLSVTILPTIFTQITQIDESWTFKILYPFIVSFMAIGTYKLYTTQTKEKTAFLATFFFITISTGKGWGSPKQMVAQLFYVLLFILLINKKIAHSKKKTLFIIFSFAIATSHYALSYIFTFIAVSFVFLSTLLKYIQGKPVMTNEFKTLTSLTLIHLIIVFSWGIYINASESFNILLDSINTVIRSMNEFFKPQSRGTALTGLGVVPTPTPLHQISTALFLLTESFIVVGFLKLITKRKETGFEQHYTILSALNLAIIAMNLLLPRLADTFLMSRFYQTTLIILAPVGILGGQTILEYIPKINLKKFSASILAITILTPLFLFQTGYIYEIAKVCNESMPLSMHRWDDLKLHHSIVETEEVLGAKWLSKYTTPSNIFVYSDIISKFQVLTAYGTIERGRIILLTNTTKTALNNGDFVFLGYRNIISGKIETHLANTGNFNFNTTELSHIFNEQNKIYSNGECEIFNGLKVLP